MVGFNIVIKKGIHSFGFITCSYNFIELRWTGNLPGHFWTPAFWLKKISGRKHPRTSGQVGQRLPQADSKNVCSLKKIAASCRDAQVCHGWGEGSNFQTIWPSAHWNFGDLDVFDFEWTITDRWLLRSFFLDPIFVKLFDS